MDGQSRSKNISFSLSGCGFLGIYHIGVASCLQRHVPQIVQEANFAGASAGAMIACCVICEVPLDQCVDFTLRLAHKTRMSALGAFNPSLNVTEILRGALDEVLPPDAHVRCTDRLFVSITELPLLTNRIISKFHSRDHLIHVLLMSAFVPGFSGYFNLPYENGKICIDGGFSVNIPILNNKTIVVSPFSGESDICPSDFDVANIVTIDLSCTSMKVSVANFCRIFDALFPPPSEQLKEMCWQGYSDAMQYLIDHKMICCPEHMMYVNLMHNAPHHHGSCEECQQTVVSAELDTYLPKAIIHILDIYHWKESSIAYRIFSSYAYKAIVIITKPWLFCVNGWFRAAYTTMTMVPFMPKSLLDRVGDMTRNLTAEAVLLMMEKAVKFLMKASLYRATDWVYSKCSAHLAVQLTVEHCEDEKILAQDLHVAGKDKDKQMEAVKDKHYPSVLTDNRASHLQVMEPESDPCVGHAKAPEDAHDQVCLAVPPVVVGDIETDTSSGATSISVLRSDQDIQFGLKVNFKTQVEPRDGAYETESTVEALEDVCIESLVLEPPEATSPASIVEKVELSLPAPLNDEQQKTPLDVKELCPESLDTMQACVEAFQEMELIMILHYLDKNHKMHAEAIYGPARCAPSSPSPPAPWNPCPQEESVHLEDPIAEEPADNEAEAEYQQQEVLDMPQTTATQTEVVQQELQEIIAELVQKERENEQQWCKVPHAEHKSRHDSSFSLQIRGWLGGQHVSSAIHSPVSNGVSSAEGLPSANATRSGGSHLLRSISDAAALARKLDVLKSGKKIQEKKLTSFGKRSGRLCGGVSASVSEWDLRIQERSHDHDAGLHDGESQRSQSLQLLELFGGTKAEFRPCSSSSSSCGTDTSVKGSENLISDVSSSVAASASTSLSTSLERQSSVAETTLYSSVSSLQNQASLGGERLSQPCSSCSSAAQEGSLRTSSLGKSDEHRTSTKASFNAGSLMMSRRDEPHAASTGPTAVLAEQSRGEEVFSRRKASCVKIGGKLSVALLQKESKVIEPLQSSCDVAADALPKLIRSRSLRKSSSDIVSFQKALMELKENSDAPLDKIICEDTPDTSLSSANLTKSSNKSEMAKNSKSYRDCVLS